MLDDGLHNVEVENGHRHRHRERRWTTTSRNRRSRPMKNVLLFLLPVVGVVASVFCYSMFCF